MPPIIIMEQLAWSDGSKPIKSYKEDKVKFDEPKTSTTQDSPKHQEDSPKHQEDSPKHQEDSPKHQGNNIMEQSIFRQPNTHREDANDKISEREMVGQTCQNPFFTKTSYVEDLDVQQNFLMPRSSNEQSI